MTASRISALSLTAAGLAAAACTHGYSGAIERIDLRNVRSTEGNYAPEVLKLVQASICFWRPPQDVPVLSWEAVTSETSKDLIPKYLNPRHDSAGYHYRIGACNIENAEISADPDASAAFLDIATPPWVTFLGGSFQRCARPSYPPEDFDNHSRCLNPIGFFGSCTEVAAPCGANPPSHWNHPYCGRGCATPTSGDVAGVP
jgi:hypothetical protein